MSDLANYKLVQDYANKICLHSKAGLNCITSLLRKSSQNSSDESSSDEMTTFKSFEVILEFICLYLHINSRWTYGEMSIARADELCDTLSTKCITACVEYGLFGYPEDTKNEIRKKSFEVFKKVGSEYSKYAQLMPENNEGGKGTLIWEFGKNIALISGIDDVMVCQIACVSLIPKALTDLNPTQFIEDLQKVCRS